MGRNGRHDRVPPQLRRLQQLVSKLRGVNVRPTNGSTEIHEPAVGSSKIHGPSDNECFLSAATDCGFTAGSMELSILRYHSTAWECRPSARERDAGAWERDAGAWDARAWDQSDGVSVAWRRYDGCSNPWYQPGGACDEECSAVPAGDGHANVFLPTADWGGNTLHAADDAERSTSRVSRLPPASWSDTGSRGDCVLPNATACCTGCLRHD